jgi:hypothetical protein
VIASRHHALARRRRTLAWVACAVWLIALELGPDLHLALHDALAAHEHRDNATRYRVEATPKARARTHRHGTVVHVHSHEHAPADRRERDPSPGARAPYDRDHAGGLAHRADLFPPAAPPPEAPRSFVLPELLEIERAARGLASLPASPAKARGPPAPSHT